MKLSGTFESTVCQPGFCHGDVELDLDGDFTQGPATGLARFEYRSQYNPGPMTIGVRVAYAPGGLTLQVVPASTTDVVGWLTALALSFKDADVDLAAKTVTVTYHLALPHDEGAVRLSWA